MSPFDHPRAEWYDESAGYTIAPVQRSDRSPRPRLRTPLDVFGVHYGGAGTSWLDSGDTDDEMRSIETFSRSARKPNQYNSASDVDGETWGYAEDWQAAHSSGNNGTVWGHLAVLGLESPTPAQFDGLVAGIRRARRQCVAAGFITPDHRVEPHQLLPGARTGCPGPLYTRPDIWERIVAPLDEQDTDPMMIATAHLWSHPDHPATFLVGSGRPEYATPALYAEWVAAGVPVIVEDNDDKLGELLAVTGLDAGRTLNPPKPVTHDDAGNRVTA